MSRDRWESFSGRTKSYLVLSATTTLLIKLPKEDWAVTDRLLALNKKRAHLYGTFGTFNRCWKREKNRSNANKVFKRQQKEIWMACEMWLWDQKNAPYVQIFCFVALHRTWSNCSGGYVLKPRRNCHVCKSILSCHAHSPYLIYESLLSFSLSLSLSLS